VTKNRNNQRKHTILLSGLAVGMLGFAFALVPLYAIFCEVTGINGKTYAQEIDAPPAVLQVSEREVTIQFLGQVGRGMPWEFRPMDTQLKVRLGEINLTSYYARNRATQAVTGQAVPSVSPFYASNYLHKIECFCFTQQLLEAGEEQQMSLRFYIDEDLPEEIKTLSLSYALFEVPELEVASLSLTNNLQ
jgi:cytochrome c oxidase assembly protein subunit 11